MSADTAESVAAPLCVFYWQGEYFEEDDQSVAKWHKRKTYASLLWKLGLASIHPCSLFRKQESSSLLGADYWGMIMEILKR